MKVGVISLNFYPEPTGIAPYASGLVRGLDDAGFDVSVFTTFAHYPQWRVDATTRGFRRADQWRGVPILRLRTYVPKRPALLNRILMEAGFAVQLAFVRSLRRQDVLIVTSPPLLAAGLVVLLSKAIRRKRRPAVVVWVQDLYARGIEETKQSSSGVVTGCLRTIESTILQKSDHVVVIHNSFFHHLAGPMRVLPQRITEIRNWSHLAGTVSPADVQAFRSLHDWNEGTVVVLHAGNMGRKQGLENVIAAARLASDRDEKVHFVLLGDGSERQRLEGLAEGLSSVEFLDPLDDDSFRCALAAADILLVNEASSVQGMAVPSKLTSYFYASRPIVAATNPETPTAHELNSAGAGARVDPGAPESLLCAVLKVGADANGAREMGLEGRRYYERVLTPDSAISAFAAVARSVGSDDSKGQAKQ